MATQHANVRDPNAPRGGDEGQPGRQDAPEGLLSMARGRLKSELNTRKNQVSDTLDGVADTMRRVGEPLRGQSAALAGYAEQAADRLRELAAGLRERDVAELVDDVETVAKRYPGAFVAGGFAAGILAARFLRSSAPEEGAPRGDEGAEAHEEQRPAAGTRRVARRPSGTMRAPLGAEGERDG